MTFRFTVLASGSAGNAALVQTEDFGLLIDVGLGPRLLASRLAAVGCSWDNVHAVLLTHTHSDHWKERTLAYLHRRGIPLYCHPGHWQWLQAYSLAFTDLQAARLVRDYDEDTDLVLTPGLRCRPLPLRHDSGPTFGFRLDCATSSLAYMADLGCWDRKLARALADVDLLALEFNHDVEMEYASGRHPRLIARVLGDRGHLSNEQAADFLREILQISTPGRLQHLVQLHLSRDCNHPSLAAQAAWQVLESCAATVQLHTAAQHQPGHHLHIAGNHNFTPPMHSHPPRQLLLPGMGT